MARIDRSDDHGAEPLRDELPASFDPRGAFAWTLRSAEIARRERQLAAAAPRRGSRSIFGTSPSEIRSRLSLLRRPASRLAV